MKKVLTFILPLAVFLVPVHLSAGIWFEGEEQNGDVDNDNYELALYQIKDGYLYYVITTVGETTYYLTSKGMLTADTEAATAFEFKAVNVEGTYKPTGWNLGYKFTNPTLSGGLTGDIQQQGHINFSGSNDRDNWERQVFFFDGSNYAIRSTNAASNNWGANSYWDVIEDSELPTAGYSLTAQYKWKFVDATAAVNLKDLLAEIAATNAIVETREGVGSGLFQKSEAELATLAAAVTAAQSVADNAEATAEDIQEARATLAAANITYNNGGTMPKADAKYTFQQKASGLFLALNESGVVLSAEPYQLSWVAVEGGGWYLTDGELYVGIAGSNNWEMSSAADKKTVINPTLAEVQGVVYYTLEEVKGLIASDGTDAGAACYADKSVANSGDKAYWKIDEYVAPIDPENLPNMIVNAEFNPSAHPRGWAEYVSETYRDIGMGIIGTYKINEELVTATVDETHLSTEYCAGFECRWASSFASYQQTVLLKAGDYKLTYDVENVNEGTINVNYDNLFSVKIGETVYVDSNTEWMQGKSNWTTHSIYFSLSEDTVVTFTLGYGTGLNNISKQETPALYVSHLQLNNTNPLIEAKISLIATLDALFPIGDGIFQYSQTDINESKLAVEAAINMDELNAVLMPTRKTPESGKAYAIVNVTAEGSLCITTGKVSIDTNSSTYFVAVEDGFALSNSEGEFIYKTNNNGWTLSTTTDISEAYIVSFIPVEDGFTINGANGLFGLDNTDNGATVFANKSQEANGLWTVVERYAVHYLVDGKDYQTDYVDYASNITLAKEPERIHYTFSGWSEIPPIMPNHDIIVTGYFMPTYYNLTYIIDGKTYATDSVGYDQSIITIDGPTIEGFTFSGWEINDSYITVLENSDFSNNVPIDDCITTYNSNIEVTGAKYVGMQPVNKWTASKLNVEGSASGIMSIGSSKEMWIGGPEFPIPSKKSDGSNTGSLLGLVNAWSTSGYYTQDVTLPSGTYTISVPIYNVENGGNTQMIEKNLFGFISEDSVEYLGMTTLFPEGKWINETISFTLKQRTRGKICIGYTAAATSSTNNPHLWIERVDIQAELDNDIPSTMPSFDLTLKGSFIPNVYAARYLVDGEDYKIDSVTYATTITLPKEPTREGFTFSGWSEIPDSMPAHDITISGSFLINSYQLVYKVDGETIKAVNMDYATELTPLAEPSKEGYTFSGWSEIPDSMPAHDVIVTGSFHINKYKLTYVLDGEMLKTDSVTYASVLTPLVEPTREGYTFSGWSEIPQTMPAGDVTITGSFLINTYLVTYMMDGEVWRTDSVTFGQGIPMPEVPARYGYVFNNWTDMPTNGLMPAHDVTVIAYYSPSEIETDDSKYVYSDEAEGYEYVSTVSEESTEVVIPQEVEGIPVTIIPEGAFADQPQVQVVTWENPAPVENTYFAAPEEHGNLLVFVASDTARVTYEGNVVRNGIAEKVTLYDGRPMTNPRQFMAEHISITKEFSKETIIGSTSGWETIVVPFDVDSITTEDGQLIAPFGSEALTDKHFWLAKMDATDGFLKVSQIRANVPYIISMPNSEGYIEEYRISGKVTFHGTNVEVQPTANATSNAGPLFGLVPTYQEVAAADSVFVLNDEPYEADGITWPAGSVFVRSSRAARPFEAYTYANASNGGHVKGYIPLDEMATGLQQVQNSECIMHNGVGAIYDLSGRRIAGSGSLKKGLYIESGQKVLVK